VDDGKSTLIGRLLLDSKSIFEDQLEAVERTSESKGYDYTDLALLTDGLRSEREQGITIDVAYRYFATPRRKFIIADTPGHVQYTRNMVTGASTADLGLVLVDARQGLTEQSRRHAVLLSLLRVPHLVLAVNKMDLVDYDQATYDRIQAEFTAFATKLTIPDLTVIPISALNGDNVVDRSSHMPWYEASRCCTTSRTCTSPPTATSSTPGSRCSTWCDRSPTPSTTTAGTPVSWLAECSSRVTRCWCCPAA
jgi:bifunctional enzyme CysN/CysC/sulfate adenylyltransferase subunit 1